MKCLKLYIIMIISILVVLGCGNAEKNEAEVKEDLILSKEFYMGDGSEVTDFTIIKRLTEDAKDTVYVTVELDNEKYTEVRSYMMNYTKYNEGWGLDGIVPYEGNDGTWKHTPKDKPSEDFVVQELRRESDARWIDECENGEWGSLYVNNIDTFFEEGTYTCLITNEVSDLENNYYSCDVITEKTFNLVNITETDHLEFIFEELGHGVHEWVLNNKTITELNEQWNLQGRWQNPIDGNVVVFFEDISVGLDLANVMSRYNSAFSETTNRTIEFRIPVITSERIVRGIGSDDKTGEYVYRKNKVSFRINPEQITDYDDNEYVYIGE